MKHLQTLILLFFVLTWCRISVTAEIKIYSYDMRGYNCWIKPALMIKNEGTDSIDISNYRIQYYFYAPSFDTSYFCHYIWWFSGCDDDRWGGDIVFEYKNFTPPYTQGFKKADKYVQISFNCNHKLAPGAYDELEFGIHTKKWDYINQYNDWSFLDVSTYELNENIAVIDKRTGEKVFGNFPGNIIPRPPSFKVSWLGNHTRAFMNSIVLYDGDAYFDTDSMCSFVKYMDKWECLSDSSGNTNGFKYGWTMHDNMSHIDMNYSDITRVRTVEANRINCDTMKVVVGKMQLPQILLTGYSGNSTWDGSNQIRLGTPFTPPPSSPDDPRGRPGCIGWDDNYLYIKVGDEMQGTDKWKRIPLGW